MDRGTVRGLLLGGVPLVVVDILLLDLLKCIFSVHVISRLRLLARGVGRVGVKLHGIAIRDGSGSRINILVQSFQHVVSRVGRLVSRMCRDGVRLRGDRVETLRTRVGPRFLCGSLSVVG